MTIRKASRSNVNATSSINNPGVGGLVPPIITTIIYTDSNYNTIDDIAIGMNGGYVRILGSGFASPFSLFLNGVQVTTNNTTFVSQNEVRALLPASSTIGTFALMLFIGNNSGNISPNGVAYSPFPVYVSPVAIAVSNGFPFTQQLGVTGDAPLTFFIISGSLPTGVTMSSSGLLSGTPTGYSTNTTLNFTVQVDDNEKQSITQAIAITVLVGDPFWKNTALLLNGVTPTTTFINDASTNNSQLAVIGDTKPNNFNPYSNGHYSYRFDGASYALGSTGTGITIGLNDFCLEGWGYWTSFNFGSFGAPIISLYGATAGQLMIRANKTANATTSANFFSILGASTYIPTSMFSSGVSVGTLFLNRWHHLAIQRVSGTWYFYVDGVMLNSTSTGDASLTLAWTSFYIGSDGPSGGGYIAGNVSNVRLSVGTVPYATAGFTVPTSPLTFLSTTRFLSAQSSRLIDNGPLNTTFTTAGTANTGVQITPFTPFAQPTTTPYNTLYSTFFDGNGDYLSVAANAALALGGPAADFTIECWIYVLSLPGAGSAICLLDLRANASPTTQGLLWILATDGSISLQDGNGSLQTGSAAGAIPANTWRHVAIVRSSSLIRIYVNGTQVNGSYTSVTTYTQTTGNNFIGQYSSTGFMNGFISNFRIVKGTALYTGSTYTVPTSSLTAVANTSLLTCQDSTIKDNSTNNFTITSFADVRPVAVSPFTMTTSNTTVTSLGSTYFDGTSDVLTLAAGTFPNLGTSNFTMEAWVYTTTVAAGTGGIFDMWNGGTSAFLLRRSASTYQFYAQGGSNIQATPVVANTWNHVAVVRNGTTITLYLNGVATGTPITAYSTSISSGGIALGVGGTATSGNECWNGYISDARIVIGTALYNANFLPPQTPLTPITNTSLLTCQFNGGANNYGITDNSSSNAIISRFGNTSQGTFSPYSQNGWSVYFPGSTAQISFSSNAAFGYGTGDFTWEMWFYPSSSPNGLYLLDHGAGNAGTLSFNGSRLVYFNATTGTGSSLYTTGFGNTFSIGTWYHIAAVRRSGITYLYLNGIQTTSAADANNYPNAACLIGQYGAGSLGFVGYISNVRIVKGLGVYTGNFTPSTIPLSATQSSGANISAITTGTSILTCQYNRFVDNSINAFTVSLVSTPTVQAFSPFGGMTNTPISYSAAFNGSSSFLTIPSIPAFGTASFTLEFWYYIPLSSIPTFATIFDMRGGTNGPGVVQPAIYVTPSVGFEWYFSATTWISSGAGNVKLNQWSHFAICRDTLTTRMFIDGVVVGTLNGDNTNYPTASSIIGKSNDGVTTRFYQGTISNFRICTQALYSSGFTPPTAPLTAISGTTFLTSNTSRIIDSSTNNLTITSTATTVTDFNPFGQTSTSSIPYTPSVNGGSIYFDGTGDYLTVPSSVTNYGSLPYTIEFWIYRTSASVMSRLFENGTSSTNFSMDLATNGTFTINNNTTISGSTSTIAVTLNSWTHVALVRTSTGTNGTAWYINGAAAGTFTHAVVIDIGTTMQIARSAAGTNLLTGYLSDLRFTQGVALYPTPFYPPVAPLTSTTTIGLLRYSSSLLLNGTSGGIIDYHGTNDLETVGNTQLISEDPYGGTYYSNFFDGTGDYIQGASSSGLIFGTGDFTVEMFFYPTANPANFGCLFSTEVGTATNVVETLAITATALTLNVSNRNVFLISAGTLTIGRWQHIAVTRSGTTLRLFLNGTLVGSVTDSTNWTADGFATGLLPRSPTNTQITGYVSNLRALKGTALYTSAFTPSVAPLTAVTNTVLLTCQSNSFKDNSISNTAITRNGDAAVKSFNPFQQTTGKSLYFDGTGDYLFIPNATASFAFGTGDFTVETWVYITSMTAPANSNPIFDTRPASTNGAYFTLFFSTGGVLTYYTNSNNAITSSVLTAGQWYHVAVSRVSGSTRMFVNGTQAGTTFTDSVNYIVGATTPLIGLLGFTRTDFLNGYLEDFRITSGVGRYTTTFTPPTAPYLAR